MRRLLAVIVILMSEYAYAEHMQPKKIQSENVKIEVIKTDNSIDGEKCSTVIETVATSGKFRFVLWKDKESKSVYINFREPVTAEMIDKRIDKVGNALLWKMVNIWDKPYADEIAWIEIDNNSTKNDFKYENVSEHWYSSKHYSIRAKFTPQTEAIEEDIIIKEMPFTIVFGYSKVNKLYSLIMGIHEKDTYSKLTAIQIDPKGLINQEDKEKLLACENK